MSWFDEVKKLAAAKILVMEQTDPQTAEMRWKTCWQCDQMEHTHKTCLQCGCYIEAKIWSKISRSPSRPMGEITYCPLGKWNDKELTNHYRVEDGKQPLE
jgi:ribosomal protein L32